MNSADWTTLAADLATPAIAAVVAFVTISQYRVSRDQMRHELFERRFDVYKKIQVFLSKILEKGRFEEESLPEFYDAMQKARFLFGEDVNGYLEEIKRHAFAEKHAEARMEETRGDKNQRSKYVATKSN
jgi:hypothetical protein